MDSIHRVHPLAPAFCRIGRGCPVSVTHRHAISHHTENRSTAHQQCPQPRTTGECTWRRRRRHTLKALAADVGAHLDRLGIERSDWVRVAKVGEQGGEVVGALIKRCYGRAETDDVLAELGDVFLAEAQTPCRTKRNQMSPIQIVRV